jgi:hypothetical protein
MTRELYNNCRTEPAKFVTGFVIATHQQLADMMSTSRRPVDVTITKEFVNCITVPIR